MPQQSRKMRVPMPDQHADRIFYNGDILTMDAAGRVVEAIAIKDGRIVAVGLRDEVLATRGPRTVITNLQVRALMPGFIDPHSHVESVGQKLASANLSPAPIGPIRS